MLGCCVCVFCVTSLSAIFHRSTLGPATPVRYSTRCLVPETREPCTGGRKLISYDPGSDPWRCGRRDGGMMLRTCGRKRLDVAEDNLLVGRWIGVPLWPILADRGLLVNSSMAEVRHATPHQEIHMVPIRPSKDNWNAGRKSQKMNTYEPSFDARI